MALALAMLLIDSGPDEPRTFTEALNSPQWPKWYEVMLDEHCSFFVNKTWDVIPRRPLLHVLTGKWVYKVKKNERGEVARYKACYIVWGFE